MSVAAERFRLVLAGSRARCGNGLNKLYNLMDDGAFTDLKALHLALDRAVVAAYGWPESVAQDGPELVRLLTERNREITEGARSYAPFGH